MASQIPYALREVLSARIIKDLRLKLLAIKRVPQEKLNALFLDMCDSGINQYIASIQNQYPEKTPSQIMKEYYINEKEKKKKV